MGTAVARRFGQHYRLLLTDSNAARLETVATMLRNEGSNVSTVVCDVTSAASVNALAASVAQQGPLRVLAHVAGLSPSMADWRTIMRVNLLGPRHVMDALLPLAQPGTAAIFIASLAAHAITPADNLLSVLADPLAPDFLDRIVDANGGELVTGLSYSYSKLGLIKLCQRQASAWGQRKARIVSLSPGMIATAQGASEFENSPAKLTRFEKTPLQRQGNMHEIADAIEFLASDRASFISGIDLLVDGGLNAATQ
jgi:NAD(P)-dependent dehydrogenase (short-subunit alcohol dehydrogenase family)